MILIEGLGVGVVWASAYIVNFKIGECRDPNDSAGIGFESRAGKSVACEINEESRRITDAEIAGRIVRTGLRINPRVVCQWQLGDVAIRATDFCEAALTEAHGLFDFGVVCNQATRNR